MTSSAVSEVLAGFQREIQGVLRGSSNRDSLPARLSLDLTLEVVEGSGTPELRLAPGAGSPETLGRGHRLTVEWSPGSVAGGAEGGVPSASARGGTGHREAARIAPVEADETGSGGDEATMRRRLELLLGGRPGFTTGAKAEVLADLLEEFGRPALLAAVRRDWITQFDTGPEASGSVSRG